MPATEITLAEARGTLFETDDDLTVVEIPTAGVVIAVATDPATNSSRITMNVEGRDLELSEFATRQFSAQLGIPSNYLMKCPVTLQATQLSYWQSNLTDRKRNQVVIIDDKIQGVTSPRFTPHKNSRLLDTTVDSLVDRMDEEDIKLDVFEHTYISTRIGLSWPVDEFPGWADRELTYGVHTANSLVNAHHTDAQPHALSGPEHAVLVLPLFDSSGRCRRPPEKELLRWSPDETDIDGWVQAGIDIMLSQTQHVQAALKEAWNTEVSDPDKVLDTQENFIPGPLRDAMRVAYQEHEDPTVYGIAQAVASSVYHAEQPDPVHTFQAERHAGHFAALHDCSSCRRTFNGV